MLSTVTLYVWQAMTLAQRIRILMPSLFYQRHSMPIHPRFAAWEVAWEVAFES